MKKLVLFVAFTVLINLSAFSQNNVGIGTNTPDASAILEMQSTTQGTLVPRMTTVQRNAIVAPANGLLVFDTTVGCFFFFNAGTWTNLCNATVGANGINCWDLNGNGVNDPSEDVNGDLAFDALDCAGATGPQGPAGVNGTNGTNGVNGTNGTNGTNGINCWDANGNGVNDPGEDVNGDLAFNSLDCVGATGPQGPAGPAGANGTNGTNGTNGAPGATGPQGPVGPQGPAGPNNVFKYSVVGTTNATVPANAAAGPFVTMPQMTITFTPVNSSVFMFFTAAGTYTTTAFANHTVWFEVLVNGVSIREWDTQCGTQWNLWDIGVSTPLTVNAGVPNTIEIRWTAQRAGATNTTINNNAATATYFNRALMILDAQ